MVVGAAIAGAAGRSLWKMVTDPGKLFYGGSTGQRTEQREPSSLFGWPSRDGRRRSQQAGGSTSGRAGAATGWQQTGGFATEEEITAFEVDETRQLILAASEGSVALYSTKGALTRRFPLPSERGTVRDMAVDDDLIYVLHPTCIGVYDFDGKEVRTWEACSETADHCGIAVTRNGVFVTDAGAKNICHYGHDGSMKRFINSPKGFVVPSYSFGIAHLGDDIYCSNPGRHLVEHYSAEGDFVGSFGQAGTADGAFCGCCNPVHIAFTPTGDMLTSEKGRPRISCFAADGTFRSTLLNTPELGGGHDAYDIKVIGGRLAVAKGKNVAFYQYGGPRTAATGLCGKCTAPCPLKVTI